MSGWDGANPEIIVAGHICLDVIPSMNGMSHGQGIGEILAPGKLIGIGQVHLSTGGTVSNTGLALHRLGLPVKLMGKIGNDLFGDAILNILKNYGESLADGMIVAGGEHSSYSLVISPPGVDRIFLHCTGANDTFTAEDVPNVSLPGARLFHFGYPPLMRKMYQQEGAELERLLSKVKEAGLTVSLDMARPEPDSPAGQADWLKILMRVLPFVDVFLPSFEEILYMLRPEKYRELCELYGTTELLAWADGALLNSLSGQLLGMGAAIVGLKLGDHGLYLRTTASVERLRGMGQCAPDAERLQNWRERELLAPCYIVESVGTTGAGDCTIAGFLAGLAKGLTIEEMALGAVGTGACNVEQADAVSGIPSWGDVQGRIAASWEQRDTVLSLPDWSHRPGAGIWERDA
ncbi:carbohydrate kinase family protein [Paenibacillus sp. FSL H8-0548]|uniref:carbohydrate kinase family protein n=1 Tax=Paenibacillus sp. FSL H8-0548 TaxID=1920422 RepID=UPI00096BE497|nr:carbohydrate kinase family protein [Paenibacillus sp. FSL H8-0548]OMF34579.1 carbohydrate kinase family protein [Paenibacillus sp. FSL H8-0548]